MSNRLPSTVKVGTLCKTKCGLALHKSTTYGNDGCDLVLPAGSFLLFLDSGKYEWNVGRHHTHDRWFTAHVLTAEGPYYLSSGYSSADSNQNKYIRWLHSLLEALT